MRKLEQLIAELCPDGVDYAPLGEVLKNNNASNSIPKKGYKEVGNIPIIDQSQAYIAAYTDDESAVPPILPCIIFGDHTRVVKYANQKFAQGDSGTKVFIPVTKALNTKYVYYAFCNLDIPSRGYNRHWAITKAIKIPLPPLPIQQEIVRILDNFTELTAGLAAELAARRKQYKYYRDLLLTFDISTPKIRLGDICTIITKGTTPKSYQSSGIAFIKTEAFDGSRIVPEKLSYIDEETHFGYLKRSILQADDILITIAGATIGKCAMVPANILPANTNQALAIIRLANGNSKKYVMYLLQSKHMKEYMQKNIKGSAQPNLNLQQLNDFIIPVPPLEEKERIVAMLDRFDALCNDLTGGLPAEIEARQKQYEYYRDKLLSFPARPAGEKEVTA